MSERGLISEASPTTAVARWSVGTPASPPIKSVADTGLQQTKHLADSWEDACDSSRGCHASPTSSVLKIPKPKSRFEEKLKPISIRFSPDNGERQPLKYDHGFLDDGNGQIDPSKMRAPAIADYIAEGKWNTIAAVATIARPDLSDAVAAYRHFQDASGTPYAVTLRNYLQNDDSGRASIAVIAREVAKAVDYQRFARPHEAAFKLRSNRIQTPSVFFYYVDGIWTLEEIDKKRPSDVTWLPGPWTENWTKALGMFDMWVNIDGPFSVGESGPDDVYVRFEVEVADRYNFNPGKDDTKTHIPDASNGRFEETGQGKEFDVSGRADFFLRVFRSQSGEVDWEFIHPNRLAK